MENDNIFYKIMGHFVNDEAIYVYIYSLYLLLVLVGFTYYERANQVSKLPLVSILYANLIILAIITLVLLFIPRLIEQSLLFWVVTVAIFILQWGVYRFYGLKMESPILLGLTFICFFAVPLKIIQFLLSGLAKGFQH